MCCSLLTFSQNVKKTRNGSKFGAQFIPRFKNIAVFMCLFPDKTENIKILENYWKEKTSSANLGEFTVHFPGKKSVVFNGNFCEVFKPSSFSMFPQTYSGRSHGAGRRGGQYCAVPLFGSARKDAVN